MNTTVFDLLPDDKIFEICEKMDNLSLTRFSQAYSRVYYLYKSIVKRRKEIRLAEELGKRHQVVSYSVFRQIVDNELNLTKIIKNLNKLSDYVFISAPLANDILFYPDQPISFELPIVPKIIHLAANKSIPLTNNEKLSLMFLLNL